MLLLFTLLSVLSFNEIVQTQEAGTLKPNQWKSLVLNQSTPEEAIKVLGQPAKTHTTSLIGGEKIGIWLLANRKDKTFQTFEFKNISGMRLVRLQYLEGKLVAIDFWFEDKQAPKPGDIAASYNLQFYPILQMFSNMSPETFVDTQKKRIEQGIITPVQFTTVYALLGVSEESFIICQAAQGAWTSTGSSVSFPGKAIGLTLISRTLEKKNQVVDILK